MSTLGKKLVEGIKEFNDGLENGSPVKKVTVRRYLCDRCGGTGQQPAGCWSGKAYDAPAGTCQTCDGEGYLGPIPPEQLSTEDSMK